MDALDGKCGLQVSYIFYLYVKKWNLDYLFDKKDVIQDIQVPGILQQNDHGGGWGVCQSEVNKRGEKSHNNVDV